LPSGFHILHVRSKTSDGQWTVTSSRIFYIVPPQPALSKIVQLEYFIDTDPGIGAATQATGFSAASALSNIPIDVNVGSLTIGFHNLFVRAKTQDGVWSLSNSRGFYVSALPVPQNIVKFEYFFDTDPGFEAAGTIAVPVTPAAPSVTKKTILASTASFTQGDHTINIRAKNTSGTWSETVSAVFTVTPPGTVTILVDKDPSDTTVCIGNPAKMSTLASGTTNIAYQWQFATTSAGPFTDLAEGGGYSGVATSALGIDTKSNFGIGRYRCKISGDLATTVFTDDDGLYIVSPPPVPAVVTSAAVCGPAQVALNASGGINGQYRWYTVPTGGTPIAGEFNSSYTTASLTASAIYYVSLNNGGCESDRVAMTALVTGCHAPEIVSTTESTKLNGVVTVDLASLISDADANLDPSTLQVSVASGVPLTQTGYVVTLNYSGTNTATSDVLTVTVCDFTSLCATQEITIFFADDITIYNGVSANGDQANDVFYIQYIDVLPDAKANKVTIYNRWGDEVFSVENYNNKDRVFEGSSTSGGKLPAGTYFYKIEFASGMKSRTGYLSLKR
jgi:gliding motility-associated-like protein